MSKLKKFSNSKQSIEEKIILKIKTQKSLKPSAGACVSKGRSGV